MLVDLTPEQIVDFAVGQQFFRIFFSKKSKKFGHQDGYTYFSIVRPYDTIRLKHQPYQYRRRIEHQTVLINSSNPLNQFELSRIVKNPFIYADEHPFRH